MRPQVFWNVVFCVDGLSLAHLVERESFLGVTEVEVVSQFCRRIYCTDRR
jgi:hypothetical protein